MIPNVYVIGATKCATTSLYHAIKGIVGVSTRAEKENTFFMKDYHMGKEELSKMYSDNVVCVDFHPNNCLIEYVADRIMETAGDAKIVLMIRNPIDRAYSEICHFNSMRPGRELGPDDAIAANIRNLNPNAYITEYDYMKQIDVKGGFYDRRYVERGMYIEHIKRFKKFSDLGVFIFERLVSDDPYEKDSLADFMGIPRFELPKLNSKSDGGSFSDKNVRILSDIYKPYNSELSELIGIDLNKEWGM